MAAKRLPRIHVCIVPALVLSLASCSSSSSAARHIATWAQLGGNCGLTGDGQAYCWGWDSEAQQIPPVPVAPGSTFRFVTGTRYQGCALAPDGMALCWGPSLNRGSRLPPAASCGGPWQRPCEFVATPVSSTLRFRTIAVGGEHGEYACGIAQDGAAWCWGRAETGRLGHLVRDTTCFPYGCYGPPTRVEAAQRFTTVAPGGAHACALDEQGRAWCWGGNSMRQTGAVTSESCPEATFSVPCTLTPNAVPGGHRFTHIASGAVHSCGVTAAGEAYCWGSNVMGELGTDRELDHCPTGHMMAPCTAVPVPVAGGHRFARIDAHEQHTCALTRTGEAWCWGAGDAGQLGQGSIEPDWPYGTRERPVRVVGDVRFTDLTASVSRNVCGRTSAGRVYCWGIRSPFRNIAAPVPVPTPAPYLVAFTPRAASASTGAARASAQVVTDGVTLSGSGPAVCANHQFDGALSRSGADLHLRVIADRLLGGGCEPTTAQFAWDATLRGLDPGNYRIRVTHEFMDDRGEVTRQRVADLEVRVTRP